jgi:hypothetical protein
MRGAKRWWRSDEEAPRKTVKTRRKAAKAKPARRNQRASPEARRPAADVGRSHGRQFADPYHAARIHRAFEMGERFEDPTANSNDQWEREVSVHPDCQGGNFWQVEWGDSDSGCYVTVFDGPMAEQRARDYFAALKDGRLKVLREI